MDQEFVVFAASESILQGLLGKAGYSLSRLQTEFTQRNWPMPLVGGSNNPWDILDRDENPITMADANGNRGFGLPFVGDPSDVSELFKALRQAAIDNSAPEIEQCAGMELVARPLAVAPSWQNWCAGSGLGRRFATRLHAERLIGAADLGANGLTGNQVNVFLVDQGLSRDYVNNLGFGDRFGDDIIFKLSFPGDVRESGKADMPWIKTQREHGSMMARTILPLAPNARIYDLPLIPPRISEIYSFTLLAALAFFVLRIIGGVSAKPTVFVNAWGVSNRFDEPTWGSYTNNWNHPLNIQAGKLGLSHDVVFAAGNSGQFCPDPGAGPYDRGPGESILGANGHPQVSSVGAVRADMTWVGTSSQGPGPDDFVAEGVNEKPDFCTPSWFSEPQDAALRASGTSAAAGMAAGVLAALRQRWTTADVTAEQMRAILRDTARRDWHKGWNGRMGAGVLNVPAAIAALPESVG